MPQLKISKFGIGDNVSIEHSHTNCHTGKITKIYTTYVVIQDDGMAFVYIEDDLKDCMQKVKTRTIKNPPKPRPSTLERKA